MFKRTLLTAAAFSIFVLAFTVESSCGSSSGGAGGGAGGGGGGSGGGASDPDLVCDASPPATTFTKVYADIFASVDAGGTTRCATCHLSTSADGSSTYGLYDTQSHAYEQVNKVSLYAGTEKTLKVVDPNHPENSSMWLKVIGHAKSPAGKSVGASMPLGSAQISDAQKKTLKDWICSGAAM